MTFRLLFSPAALEIGEVPVGTTVRSKGWPCGSVDYAWFDRKDRRNGTRRLLIRDESPRVSVTFRIGKNADVIGQQDAMARLVSGLRPGRPATRPTRVLADKGYSSRANRAYLRRRRIHATIPERADQQANRARRGRAGGRPPTFDPVAYKRRNVVERCFNRFKLRPRRRQQRLDDLPLLISQLMPPHHEAKIKPDQPDPL